MRCVRVTPVLALVLAGCITDPVTGKSVVGMPTSEADEQSLGLSNRPVIVQQFSGAYPDAALQDYMGRIVLGMAHASVRPELPWTFTIVNSSVPNAFAVAGGQVFITRGLLWRLDDEAEFAVVMGHEIGHVEHKHTIQAMGRDTLVGALGQLGGQAIGSEEVGGIATTLLTTRFSRDQEREADVRGVNNSYHAGYDPRRGAEVFRKFLAMKQEQGGGESVIDAWTSDHPLDTERIQSITQLSGEIDPRLKGTASVPGLKVQTGRFAELIANLRGVEKTYDRHDAAMAGIQKAGGGKDAIRAAIPEFEACVQAQPGHAYFASTLGKAYLAAGDTQQAQRWLDRAASMGQDLLEPEYLLGLVALDGNRWGDAGAHAQRGLSILPDNYLCLWVRGEANWNLGRKDEATADFQKVIQAAPQDSPQAKAASSRIGGTQPEPVARPKKKKAR
jgi:predicted Zn-dependent protease